MPLIDLVPANKRDTTPEFEKFKLKKGEKARVVLLNPRPHFEWVHTVRIPATAGGEVVMSVKERKDGSTYETYRLDFIGRPLCKGNYEVIADSGSDPDNCPLCEAAVTYPEYFGNPDRRFAMNIFQYDTKLDGAVKSPYHGSVSVWSFTDQIFSKLVEISQEQGDLKMHDLVCGPCTNEDFQKFEITPSAQALWTARDDIKLTTAQIWKENQYTPEILKQACGRDAQIPFMRQDINRVLQKWAEVKAIESGAPVPGTTGEPAGNFDNAMAGLLNGAAAPSAEAPDLDDILNTLGTTPVAAPAPAAPVEPPAVLIPPSAVAEPSPPAVDLMAMLEAQGTQPGAAPAIVTAEAQGIATPDPFAPPTETLDLASLLPTPVVQTPKAAPVESPVDDVAALVGDTQTTPAPAVAPAAPAGDTIDFDDLLSGIE